MILGKGRFWLSKSTLPQTPTPKRKKPAPRVRPRAPALGLLTTAWHTPSIVINTIFTMNRRLFEPGCWINPFCPESVNEFSDAIVGDTCSPANLDGHVDEIPLLGLAADRAGGQVGGNAIERRNPAVLPVFSQRSLAQHSDCLITVCIVHMRPVKFFENCPRHDLVGVECDEVGKKVEQPLPHTLPNRRLCAETGENVTDFLAHSTDRRCRRCMLHRDC